MIQNKHILDGYENEKNFILSEANWYIQPSDWQYKTLEEIINSQKMNG